MKYKPGQKVKIREDLEDKTYNGLSVFPEMLQLKGKQALIDQADEKTGVYWIDQDHYRNRWTDDMFEPLVSEKQKVTDNLSPLKNKDGKRLTLEETSVLLGVAPDEPVITNENGGKQSDTPYGFHQLPIQSMFAAAQTAKYGADKYGETFDNRNYTKISVEEHINHAIQHLYAYLAGDTQDEHLSHAIVRTMFAYDVDHRNKLEGSCDA